LHAGSPDGSRTSLRPFPVGNYIVFYLPLPDGINVVRILNGYRDITADDVD
jgi:toxin ParE1/3/4